MMIAVADTKLAAAQLLCSWTASKNPVKILTRWNKCRPENLRRKDDSVMPDYQAVYERLTMPGSKANLFYLWLKYKKDCPSGYQYTQYCLYFKRFVEKHYGSEAVSMVVERIPGEKVYIDWVGDQPEILVDSSTGEIKKVHFSLRLLE